MFTVPVTDNEPAEKITFWRWLTSRKSERRDWYRRREAARKAVYAARMAEIHAREAAFRAEARERWERKHPLQARLRRLFDR